MIRPLPPHLYRCPHCHWFKVITHAGCVRMEGYNSFDRCPVCGCDKLEYRPCPSWMARIAQWLEKQSIPRKP